MNIYRLHFLAGAALLLSLPANSLDAQTPNRQGKPNIVLIFVDDMGYGDPGCYGGTKIPTPNIDSLARDGIRCANGYVTASVCGPSRLGLLSGSYQQRFGVFWNNDLWQQYGLKIPKSQKLLPETLRSAGYKTGHVGKWNITPDPSPYVDEAFAVMNWKGAYYPNEEGTYLGVDGPDFRMEPHGWGPPRQGDEYLTDRLTRHATDFIDRHSQEPFFLYVAYNAPHTPLQADRKYADRFRELQDEPNRLYAGMVSALDDGIGRVLDKLSTEGLEQNTLVVLASDNGPARGSNYLRGWHDDWPKQTLLGSAGPLNGHKAQRYEGGIRIPFIVRWPAQLKRGQTYDQPVSTLDLYPTFCAAAGVKPPLSTHIDGVDLLPYLRGDKQGSPHQMLYWKSHNGGAIRKGNWKLLIQSPEVVQLFDLNKDLGEQHNVAAENPDVVKQLVVAFNLWCKDFPDQLSQRAKAAKR